MDPFKILGVNRDATQEEILAAYARKIAKYPPETLDDDDQWILQQINEALAALSSAKNPVPIPPALPAKSIVVGAPSPTPIRESEIHESAISIDSDDSKGGQAAGRRSRRNKTNSLLPTLIGTVGGAICAALVGWYVLGFLQRARESDNPSTTAFGLNDDTELQRDHSQDSRPLFSRRSNPKTANSSKTNQAKPGETVDHIGSAINKDSDNRASDKPVSNQPFPNRQPPKLGGIQPGKNQPNMAVNDPNDKPVEPPKRFPNRPVAAAPNSEFWKTIKRYADGYQKIDQTVIAEKRRENLSKWLTDFQSELNNKTAEVEYAVREISQFKGAIYDVRFTALLGTGMNQANIHFPRLQRVRTNNRDRKNVQPGSTVKFTGKVAMTIPAAGVPLHNQPPYMAIFRLTLRGRHDPVTIDFAIQNPQKQFLLPE